MARKKKLGYSVLEESVIGRLCCWSCQATDKQLLRCPDYEEYVERTKQNGDVIIKIKRVKSQDYICSDCVPKKGRVRPPIGNVSIQLFMKP